jgi:hypothetical protein
MSHELLTGQERLAPGVFGYATETDRGLYVGWIAAEREGSGDVGRYLDQLPRDRRVVFPTILSLRLAGMLLRRGFTVGKEYAEEFGEWVDLMERVPA